MIRSARRAACYGVALLCLILAVFLLYHGFTMAVTVGDAQFVPDQACDARCRAAWEQYGQQADHWMTGAGAALTAAIGFGWSGRIVRHRAPLQAS